MFSCSSHEVTMYLANGGLNATINVGTVNTPSTENLNHSFSFFQAAVCSAPNGFLWITRQLDMLRWSVSLPYQVIPVQFRSEGVDKTQTQIHICLKQYIARSISISVRLVAINVILQPPWRPLWQNSKSMGKAFSWPLFIIRDSVNQHGD